jgi:hypothetical protein
MYTQFPTNIGLNGTMTVNTTAVRTTSNCSNPVRPFLRITAVIDPNAAAQTGPPTVNLTAGTITSTSLDGCAQNITFDPTVCSDRLITVFD